LAILQEQAEIDGLGQVANQQEGLTVVILANRQPLRAANSNRFEQPQKL
jgi:hypothetical protein